MGAGAERAGAAKRIERDGHRKGDAAIARVGNRTDSPASDNEAADLCCPSHEIKPSERMEPELQEVDVEGKVSMRAPAQPRAINVQLAQNNKEMPEKAGAVESVVVGQEIRWRCKLL